MQVKPIHVVGIAVGGWALWAFLKLRRVGRLVFFPGGIHSFKFVGSTPVIEFNVQIQNTSSYAVTVNSLAGNLYADGVLIGNVFTQSLIDINSNSAVIVRLTAQLGLLGVVNTLIASYQGRDGKKTIMFDGYANIDDLQVPIELKFNVGL